MLIKAVQAGQDLSGRVLDATEAASRSQQVKKARAAVADYTTTVLQFPKG